jgi:hypothetical protein
VVMKRPALRLAAALLDVRPVRQSGLADSLGGQ